MRSTRYREMHILIIEYEYKVFYILNNNVERGMGMSGILGGLIGGSKDDSLLFFFLLLVLIFCNCGLFHDKSELLFFFLLLVVLFTGCGHRQERQNTQTICRANRYERANLKDKAGSIAVWRCTAHSGILLFVKLVFCAQYKLKKLFSFHITNNIRPLFSNKLYFAITIKFSLVINAAHYIIIILEF